MRGTGDTVPDAAVAADLRGQRDPDREPGQREPPRERHRGTVAQGWRSGAHLPAVPYAHASVKGLPGTRAPATLVRLRRRATVIVTMRFVILSSSLVAAASCTVDHGSLTKDELGAIVFNDQSLSSPAGMSCADCHDPATAFSDPEDDRTSAGVLRDRFGFRNAQTVMYGSFAPPLHVDPITGRVVGGLFWDGRAADFEAQAGAPLLNPVEMNNKTKQEVVEKIRHARYAGEFRRMFGPAALDDVDTAFGHVGDVLAAFERTPPFAPFSSKYDHYLAGTATLDEQELRGLAIFEDPARGNCASCHPSRPSADGTPPLFTDFSYANLGIPRFGNSPFYTLPKELNPEGEAFIDHGLTRTTGDPAHDGMFRTPTLRNIARTFPYGHNGYFRRLGDMIDFLNTRDVGSEKIAGACSRLQGIPPVACPWPSPEVATNIDHAHTGHLGLSDQDVTDLLAFLATLSDEPPAP
jgi:cytochrome c peroxidase